METTIRNFYAGPGKLPQSVLERVERELKNYRGTGMSVMEISHRAAPVVELIARTQDKIRQLMGLSDEDAVLFMQGGGSLQFLLVPMNLSMAGDPVDYVDTGYWTGKAIDAARSIGRDIHIAATDHQSIPSELNIRPDARYLHICTNNTVMGTQWHSTPDTDVPIVADMSSDILSRNYDTQDYSLIYAHAQKTIGSAGVTVVIIPKKTQALLQKDVSPFLDYNSHIEAKSNYHTPPVFAIYMVECMLDWLKDEMGGLDQMEEINRIKAKLLYDALDNSSLFNCPIAPDSRSMMNVVFDAKDQALASTFSTACQQAGIVGVDGHRMRGGFRASLYNAVSIEDVETLVKFMQKFEHSYT